MKKSVLIILFVLVLVICLSACGQKNEIQNTNDIIAFQMISSLDGVEDFLKLLGDYNNVGYETDTCYNVTPENIANEYGFSIFKFDTSCRSFLMYENKIYLIGEFFGGYGVTSFAIGDINADNKNELYFTYSWGSGIHRSQVGYFDTANKEITIFDFQNLNMDSVLMEDNNILCVYNASCNVKSFVDIEMLAESKTASIILDSEKITFAQEVN